MNARLPLIVHLGQHKTGSKALQSFLAHNRKLLRRHGILYPAPPRPSPTIPAYEWSHYSLFALLRREALAATAGANAAESYWRHQAQHCHPFEDTNAFFGAIEKERRRGGVACVVLSAEDLFDMHTAHETAFAPDLIAAAARRLANLAESHGYDARLIVYLRRQDHLLGAHYVQLIKGCEDHDMDMPTFRRHFAERLRYRAILRHWENAFGRDRIAVRPYEQATLPDGIVTDFARGTGGSPVRAGEPPAPRLDIPPGCTQPAATIESVNASVGRDFVEFLRILNRRAKARLPIFARDIVLEAGQQLGPMRTGPAGIGAWLSPAERRELLAEHEADNSAIARDFLGRDGPLFTEPLPEDAGWQPYPGLSAETATAFALAAHELVSRNGKRRWFAWLRRVA